MIKNINILYIKCPQHRFRLDTKNARKMRQLDINPSLRMTTTRGQSLSVPFRPVPFHCAPQSDISLICVGS